MSVCVSWSGVQPLPTVNGDVAGLLSTIDDLRRVWAETLTLATPDEVERARKRSLRRHAIETGIIERLYDLDWGVTEALVAEGLTIEAAESQGGITEDVLTVIRDQYDALDRLADLCRDGAELTLTFIRELHVLITQHQPTYQARDQFGRDVQAPLPHGDGKTQPNHAVRDDGSRVEFAPPEQVQSAMEVLLDQHRATEQAHPIVRAAWLHHQFILIHPFADGNGRVARALTMLVLLQAHYAPIVVDRRQRPEYLTALNTANTGDLRPFVRFLARLEGIALRSALLPPEEPVTAGGSAVEVARAYARRLQSLGSRGNATYHAKTATLATDLHARLGSYLDTIRVQFRDAFQPVDPEVKADVYQAAPGDDRANWWRFQIIRTANAVDFYSNLRDGSWWTRLRLTVLGQSLRYVAVLQKVGRGETGVLAITIFAESIGLPTEDGRAQPAPLWESTPDDSVTLIYSDTAENRWPEISELLDRTLAATIAGFSTNLG